jgi:hypothetical protein
VQERVQSFVTKPAKAKKKRMSEALRDKANAAAAEAGIDIPSLVERLLGTNTVGQQHMASTQAEMAATQQSQQNTEATTATEAHPPPPAQEAPTQDVLFATQQLQINTTQTSAQPQEEALTQNEVIDTQQSQRNPVQSSAKRGKANKENLHPKLNVFLNTIVGQQVKSLYQGGCKGTWKVEMSAWMAQNETAVQQSISDALELKRAASQARKAAGKGDQ